MKLPPPKVTADFSQLSLFTPTEPDPIVVAYGMGDDSTALLIGLHQKGIRPTLILFADTGSEDPRTYAYLAVMNAWLEAHGFPKITVLRRRSPRAGDMSLAAECARKSILPSLAYGGHSCSLKWKVDPQWAFCKKQFGWMPRRQSWAHGPTITKMIGYDSGPKDTRRVKKATGKWPPGHHYVYPLIEWGWDRERCQAEILAAGLPLPGKSSCFMCPAMQKAEINTLARTHPVLLAYALLIERRAIARGLRTTKGLGRRFAWADYLVSTECPDDVRHIAANLPEPMDPSEYVLQHHPDSFRALLDSMPAGNGCPLPTSLAACTSYKGEQPC